MVKGFLIAGTNSGCGKTLVTLGILRLLKRLGYEVQAYKAGPDYIDPAWHKACLSAPSVNLDVFSMQEEVKSWFAYYAKGKDFLVVEGTMGLCDGEFSSLKLASILRLPVILVVDAYGIAESIEPVLTGFKWFVEKENLKLLVFLNRVGSQRHLKRLKNSLAGLKLLGFLPFKKSLSIASRHLGLHLPHEYEVNEFFDELGEEISKNLDLELLNSLVISEKVLASPLPRFDLFKGRFKRLAIAKDGCFCFYYTHFLDMLKHCGEVVEFSPLADEEVPEGVDFVYIGGGYPEVYAEVLNAGKNTKRSLKEFVAAGGRIYAECGGLIYLGKKLFYEDKTFEMAGILPVEAEMKRLKLGYVRVFPKKDAGLFKGGIEFRGHEFHYTRIKENKPVEKIYRCLDIEGKEFEEGYRLGKVLGTYIHFVNFPLIFEKELEKPKYIEKTSMDIIEESVDLSRFSRLEKEVVKRVIHATADFEFADTMVFSKGVMEKALQLLKQKKAILVDVEMIKAGVSKRLLNGVEVLCYLAQVKAQKNTTRVAKAIEKALLERDDIGIIAIGNAPTGLLKAIDVVKSLRLEDVVFIGMPVGFVKALEAKLKLYNSDLPFITNLSRKGGSSATVAALNALLKLAKEDSGD